MENRLEKFAHPARRHSLIARLAADKRGAVLIEAAVAISLLITVLAGIVTYGLWFMTAHSLQQIANEAARSTLGAMNADERDQMVDDAIAASLAQTGVIDDALMRVDTRTSGSYYTVRLRYDISKYPLFSATLIPLPADTIVRTATIEVSTL